MLVAASNALSIPASVHDLMLQNYRVDIEHLYVLPYVAIMLFVVLLLVLLRRYLAAVRENEQANIVLAQRLLEREAQLSESHARLRAVERDQVLAQERDRLMQDMHDGLGSSLMGALKAVEHGGTQDLAQVLRDCIEDLKLAIDSLEPVQADLLLLLATLRFRLGSRLEQAGIRLQWEVQDVPPLPWLDPQSALHILRILQEVLGNAVRHSGAALVTVATRLEAGTVLVTVDDDGKGFDPQATGGRGRGLVHIQRRAEAIGAAAQWLARPQGMRFQLAMPVGTA
jgi:signal transduction histidine kinase